MRAIDMSLDLTPAPGIVAAQLNATLEESGKLVLNSTDFRRRRRNRPESLRQKDHRWQVDSGERSERQAG
jgi:hypothetical protein